MLGLRGENSGRRLSVARRTTSLTPIANTTVADTGVVLPDFVVGYRPTEIEIFIPQFQAGNSVATCWVSLTNAAGSTVYVEQQITLGVAGIQSVTIRAPFDTPGSYSGLKVRHRVANAANTVAFNVQTAGTTPFAVQAQILDR